MYLDTECQPRTLAHLMRIQISREQHMKGRVLTPEHNFYSWKDCKATDPRDRFFGVLGLMYDTSVEDHTQHDYQRTVEEIYIEAAVWALCQRDHPSPLAVLSMAGIGLRRSLSLPSWVPDLTSGSDLELEFMLPTPIGFWEYRENGYMASGDTEEDSEISASYRLSIKAIRVDEIQDLIIVLEGVHLQYPGIDLDLEDYVLAATCLFSLSKYAQRLDGLEILWRSIAPEVASGTPSTRDNISEFI
jgi:hypothetical protein